MVKIIIKNSHNYIIDYLVEEETVMAKIKPGTIMKKQKKNQTKSTYMTGTWTCTCGAINTADTCNECGMPKIHIKE